MTTQRPVANDLHPLETGNYRIATAAIEAFYALVVRCLHNHIPGALVYGPSRIGKTRAIEYLQLLAAMRHPKITTYCAHAEHKPRHAEGPFFSSLLTAVGFPNPDGGTSQRKRQELLGKIRESCARRGSGTVMLFCDEAQRYTENEYEWLRDVHDALDKVQIRLHTILVGQSELRAVKTAYQRQGKTQIVARLMVEEMAFFGIRNARDVATCLGGYDETCYPATSDWTYTRFYAPAAVASGFRLIDEAAVLWSSFADLHHKHGFSEELEIPMESFTRAVEMVLRESMNRDKSGYRPVPELWNMAVRQSGYVQSRVATSLMQPIQLHAA
jgi:hypothetical protein